MSHHIHLIYKCFEINLTSCLFIGLFVFQPFAFDAQCYLVMLTTTLKDVILLPSVAMYMFTCHLQHKTCLLKHNNVTHVKAGQN